MLTSIRVVNELGYSIELPLFGSTSAYVVKDIQGLGPVKADIGIATYAQMDGGVAESARAGIRNIVLDLGFDPSTVGGQDLSAMRRDLYPWFMPKNKVALYFISTHMPEVKICGIVEAVEPTVFTITPSLSISIICEKPYFESVQPVNLSRSDFGDVSFVNPGDVESGMILTVDSVSSLTGTPFVISRKRITANGPVQDQTMEYVGGMYTHGEPMTFQVVTIRGEKSASWKLHEYYVPGERLTGANILGYVHGWVYIAPGPNIITVELPTDTTGDKNIYLEYTPRYGGI